LEETATSAPQTFGLWLKHRRKELDLTQEDLACRVACASATIRKLEAGTRRPSKPLLEQLAHALEISPDQHGRFIRLARARESPASFSSIPSSPTPSQATVFHLSVPTPTTALIGRVQDVFAVRHMLGRDAVRLLTIVGPPGIGKTRLSLQSAVELHAAFSDGVAFVSLATIADPGLVIATIARTLGIQESNSRPTMEQLKAFLRPQQMLLVLDNFEQVAQAAPELSELLAAAPRLKLLVTSRVGLQLYGEHKFQTPPLAVPDLATLLPVAELVAVPAVALFVQRAQAAVPDFALSPKNAAAVAELCVRLDGIPLAIELAAARIELYSPAALLARLNDRLALLTAGAQDAPARQRTLRATLEWSYLLLRPDEQAIFRRLGVFVGGWTAEAAEAIGDQVGDQAGPAASANGSRVATTPTVADVLLRLLNHSLVQRVKTGDETVRFTMLETIREYALEQLQASGEAEAIYRRYVHFFLALTETAAPKLKSAARVDWFGRLDAERDNLRAALAQSRTMAGGDELALRLSAALWPYWWALGYHHEARSWLETTLAQSSALAHSRANAEGLMGAGLLLAYQGDYSAARRYSEQSVALWRELDDRLGLAHALRELAGVWRWAEGYCAGQSALYDEAIALYREVNDVWGLALALNDIGAAARVAGRTAEAREWLEQSLALFRSSDDTASAAFPLLNLAILASQQGHDALALTWAEESAAIFRQIGNTLNLAISVWLLGKLLAFQGDYRLAQTFLQESLEMHRGMGAKQGIAECLRELGYIALRQGHLRQAATHLDEGWQLAVEVRRLDLAASCLVGLAGLHQAAGEPQRAVLLLGAADALQELSGRPVHQMDRIQNERILASVRAQLGEAPFAAAWREGRTMDATALMSLSPSLVADSIRSHTPPTPSADALTAREREVLCLLAAGLSNTEIGRQLVITQATVKTHVRAIYDKLNIHSRSAATRFAFDHGLI
jgi:predicted ATPase/DNA-binding CsgD family transcriptional regulator/transcriptional regulator with XRE-family HTH domain